jgi:hypothetical protein
MGFGQFGNRDRTRPQLIQHGTPRGIGKGLKNEIESRIFLSHMALYVVAVDSSMAKCFAADKGGL